MSAIHALRYFRFFPINSRFLGVFIVIILCFQPNRCLWGQSNTYQGDLVEFTHPLLDAQFNAYEVYSLDVFPLYQDLQDLSHFEFELRLGEAHQWDINLSLNNMLASDFQLIELGEEEEQFLALPVPFTYEGFNNSSEVEAGSAVRLSIREDAIVGYVYHNEQQYYIEPLSYFVEDAPLNYFLVYQPEQVNMELAETCGAVLQEKMKPYLQEEAIDLSKNEENCLQVEMLVLATQDMVAHLGSPSAVINRIFDISNQMEGYYSFANFDFLLSQFFISTSPSMDPVSSTINADDLLSEVQHWVATTSITVHPHDLGQLWVKRDIAGCSQPPTNFNLWGCGNQAKVCQGSRYNVCELATSNVSCMARLSAHEIGHNFNGSHSDAPNSPDLMDPNVSCGANQGFSIASQNAIHSYVASPVGSCIKLCSELCDAAISGFSVTEETCPGQQDGSITIFASTSYGGLEYAIAGPVNLNNQTGFFPNLPAGSYNLFVFDPQFEICQDQQSATVTSPPDEEPILVCPENITVDNEPGHCHALVSIPQPGLSDDCGIAEVQYRIQQVDENGNPVSSWSTWRAWFSTDLNPSETLAVGNWKIEWQAIDNSGNENICSFCVEVVDAESFSMLCPPSFVSVLSTGFCISFIEVPLPLISGNCEEHTRTGRIREVDIQGNPLPGNAGQWSSYASNLDGFFYVGIFEVEWMATDQGQHMRQCTFTFEVKDEELPMISCPPGIIVGNDAGTCEAYVNISAPSASDNCGVSWLKARYRRVDAQGNPIPGAFGAWSNFANDLSGDYPVGAYQINWKVRDPSGNKSKCFFFMDVEDREPPVAVCRDNTVYLDSDGGYDIQDFEVLDFFQSSDNCGGLQLTNIEPPSVDCNDENSIVSVHVTAADDAGNSWTCTSFLQVEKDDALPFGWDDALIGSTTGDAVYDPCTESFTLQSTGTSSPFDDLIQMAFKNQCGNFDLIAKVDQVNSGGFAGIMVRETNYSGAKKVALKTQLTPRVYRQFRFSTDGFTSTSSLPRFPSHPWLRIIRTGSNFTGYSSANGSNWQFAFSVPLNLPNCIMAGLYSEGVNGNFMTTAQFSQVSFNGIMPLQTPETLPSVSYQYEDLQQSSINLYPNPSADFLYVDLKSWSQAPIELNILNISGQVMWHKSHLITTDAPLEIDLGRLPDGIYFLEVKNGDKMDSRRFHKN